MKALLLARSALCAGVFGAALIAHQRAVSIVAGVVSIVMGLAFAGVLPMLQRNLKPGWALVAVAAFLLLLALFPDLT